MALDSVPVYRNALEPAVVREVHRQLQTLPPRLVSYINPVQVIAYALNRLPPLYATSEKGWELQQQRIHTELEAEIVMEVRRGIAAVERDPFRAATPFRQRNDAPTI
ncbi:late competence development ComFB family protein [Kamptonema formosum]|uniref:late competence development ComFB family protein n=1 Tax=Kamptonema formosum TaxID=331992 RepID=UPI00034A9D64|nr:late competence development ComFB family protein [Oscillatoria sp. PCC 10802]